MTYKLKSNDGVTVVLSRNHSAKLALEFSADYNLANSVNLAILAELVYAPFNNAKRQLDGLKMNERMRLSSGDGTGEYPFLSPYQGNKVHFCQGMTKIAAVAEDISILDTQAFHYNDDTCNVLVFRGTKGKRDLMADGFAPKIEFLAGKVHQGFYENFNAVKKTIKEIFDKPENRKCKTIIAGHSLGGALSTLAAAYIATNYASDPCGQVMVYTYGSPRVGDKQWVEHFSSGRPFLHFRHRRTGDPITMLPPHHSSMRIPTVRYLEKQAAAGAVPGIAGGSVLGPIGAVVGGTVSAAGAVGGSLVLSVGSSDGAEHAFVHHGQGVWLHHLGPEGADLALGNLPAEVVIADGKYFHSKELLLGRELWQDIYAFRNGIEPHKMGNYVAELAHLLKLAIAAWDKDPAAWLAKNKRAAQEWQAELERARQERTHAAMTLEPAPAAASSTSTASSRQTPTAEEKKDLYDRMVEAALFAKAKADQEVGIWSRPDAKSGLFHLVFAGEAKPWVEKEMRFQAAHIK